MSAFSDDPAIAAALEAATAEFVPLVWDHFMPLPPRVAWARS
jgi:hypothetical protein